MTPELQKQYEQDRDAEIRHIAIMPVVAKAMKIASDWSRSYTIKQMEGEIEELKSALQKIIEESNSGYFIAASINIQNIACKALKIQNHD